MVFNDKENLQLLNKLIHPLIRKRTQKMIDRCRKDRIFLEIPLLFENKLQDGFDLILNVSADEEIQFYRLKKNRDLKEKDIKKRLSAQFNANKKKELADINIDNNGTKKELFQKLEALYPTLKKTPKKHITKLIKL